MTKQKRQWATTARMIDTYLLFFCAIIANILAVCLHAFGHHMIGYFFSGITLGYVVSVMVSGFIWHNCPIMLANDIFFLGTTSENNSFAFNYIKNNYGIQWVARLALIQSIGLAIIVAPIPMLILK